jgi:archaemetzincin
MCPALGVSLISPILLVPISPIDPSCLQELSGALAKAFSRRVETLKSSLLDGSFAFDFSRNQYNSTKILSALLEKFNNHDAKILGVTGGDLFVPVLTYVFGEAQFEGKAAVVSLHRLREEFYGLKPDENIFKSRLVKEAIHELGHIFGLIHCGNYLCVMHSSTGVEEIDLKTEQPCESCREKLDSLDRCG